MSSDHVINVDLARIWSDPKAEKEHFIRTMGWGDFVDVEEITDKHVKIKTHRFVRLADGSIKPRRCSGFIVPKKAKRNGRPLKPKHCVRKRSDSKVLKVNFVDVQQGDGTVIETPGGRIMLIDGGDNQLFARYLAGRYRKTSKAAPRDIDCIVVTHGDADHFAGLTKIRKSETHDKPWKRIFIRPHRVYHNGLVKRPTKIDKKSVPDTKLLGRTVKLADGTRVIVELEDDLLATDKAKMNRPFRTWQSTLRKWSKRGPVAFRRLAMGNDDAFDFLSPEGLEVEVLGPMLTDVGDGREGLAFLGDPHDLLHSDLPSHQPDASEGPTFAGSSASHTINGHSIILRLTYGGFRFLFSGDLNQQAALELTKHHKQKLRADVLKVPHHGAADFSTTFLDAVRPAISVISSGDESVRKEYIHPRASLVGALGKYGGAHKPIVFVTELVAFFEVMGWINAKLYHRMRPDAKWKRDEKVVDLKKVRRFFSFQRAAYGLVKVRTDGKRLLVYTDSANIRMNEAYSYQAQTGGRPPKAVEVLKV